MACVIFHISLWSKHFFHGKPKHARTVMINWLWPTDAIWRHRTGSTLAQVMAWYLTTPSHNLNQECWLIKCVELEWLSKHWGLDKRWAIFKCIFLTQIENVPYLPIQNSFSIPWVPGVKSDIRSPLVCIMAQGRIGNKALSEPMMT